MRTRVSLYAPQRQKSLKEGGRGAGIRREKRDEKARSEQGRGVQPEDLGRRFLNEVIASPRSQHCVTNTIHHHHQMPFETFLDA